MKTMEAASYFGNRKRLAEALEIVPEAVYQWGEYPPVPRQYQIQVLSKGKLKAN